MIISARMAYCLGVTVPVPDRETSGVCRGTTSSTRPGEEACAPKPRPAKGAGDAVTVKTSVDSTAA